MTSPFEADLNAQPASPQAVMAELAFSVDSADLDRVEQTLTRIKELLDRISSSVHLEETRQIGDVSVTRILRIDPFVEKGATE